MSRIEWDFSKRPAGEALGEACEAAHAVQPSVIRRKMMKALEGLGYHNPLVSERYRVYRDAGVHKFDYQRHDRDVIAEYNLRWEKPQ